MWILLSLLLLLFVGMLSFSLAARYYFCKSKKISLIKLDNFSAVFLCFSIILGGTLLYGSNLHLPIYTWFFILLLLFGLFYFSQNKWTYIQKTLFRLSLCIVGTFGVLMPAPEMNILYWLLGLNLLITWFFGWRLISNFDKYPLTTYLNSSSWCIALLLIYCILNNFPNEISLFAAILGISVFVISRKRLFYGIQNLGQNTAEITGFIWAGIWSACLLETNLAVFSLFYGYYLMEIVVLIIKHFKKKPLDTLLLQAIPDNKRRRKAITLIFFHVMIMTFLGAFLTVGFNTSHMAVSASLFLLFVICFNLYNHLKDLDHPIGTWKDIFSELKNVISEFPKASKDMIKEVKSGLKTQTRKRKKSIKKRKGNKKRK